MIFAWRTIVQKGHSQLHSTWPCWTADIVLTKQSCESWTSRRRRLLTLMTPSKMGMFTFLFFIIKPHSGANCLFLAYLWCNFFNHFFVFFGPFRPYAYNDNIQKTQVKQHQAIVTPGRPCVGREPFQQSSWFPFQRNKNFDVKVDNCWRQHNPWTQHYISNQWYYLATITSCCFPMRPTF